MIAAFRWFGPAVAYAALIFYLSHQSTLPAPPTNDKIVHIVAYTIMGGLYLRALRFGTGWPRRFVWSGAFIAASVYGALDEFHQSFIPGRHASFGDLIADVVGAAIGTALAYAIYRAVER